MFCASTNILLHPFHQKQTNNLQGNFGHSAISLKFLPSKKVLNLSSTFHGNRLYNIVPTTIQSELHNGLKKTFFQHPSCISGSVNWTELKTCRNTEQQQTCQAQKNSTSLKVRKQQSLEPAC